MADKPGMPRTDLRGYFAAISARLRLQVEVMTPVIVHSGEMGDNDHLWFADFLRQYLPLRIAVESGFVVNAKSDQESLEYFSDNEGPRSQDEGIGPQNDILLVDLLENAPLCNEKAFRVFPVEMVLGVIEITRLLKSGKLAQDLEKVARVRQLAGEQHYSGCEGTAEWPRPHGYIVGLKSDLSPRMIHQHIQAVPEHLRPNAILILDREKHESDGTSGELLFARASDERYLKVENDTLFHFLSLVRYHIENSPIGRTDLRAYLAPHGSIHWGESMESSSSACEDDIVQCWEESGIASPDMESERIGESS